MAQNAAVPLANVLMVDDEPTILRGYARWLKTAGYTVSTATDAEEAVRMASGQDFDVVISDVSMPGMSGIDLLRTLRQRGLDVPFIIVTGAPALETAVDAVEYGALKYLSKPVAPDELERLISRAVEMRRSRPPRESAADREELGKNFDKTLGALWAAYQPIVRWSNQRIYAFEALMRSEEKSLPHPGAILEAAEKLDRLSELGRVMREKTAHDWVGCPSPNVFVNLHTRDLLDDALFDPEAPLSRISEHVVLEITERAAVGDVSDFRARIGRLRDMGFRMAIDDLGAGFAGLSSLAQVEPEVVKIDMSLVRDVHTSATKRRLVESVARLCRDMGKLVVAEGVETVAERDTLVELGCDLFQGYLFAKPGRPFPDAKF